MEERLGQATLRLTATQSQEQRLDALVRSARTTAGVGTGHGATRLSAHSDWRVLSFLNQPTRWRQQYTKPALLRALELEQKLAS